MEHTLCPLESGTRGGWEGGWLAGRERYFPRGPVTLCGVPTRGGVDIAPLSAPIPIPPFLPSHGPPHQKSLRQDGHWARPRPVDRKLDPSPSSRKGSVRPLMVSSTAWSFMRPRGHVEIPTFRWPPLQAEPDTRSQAQCARPLSMYWRRGWGLAGRQAGPATLPCCTVRAGGK